MFEKRKAKKAQEQQQLEAATELRQLVAGLPDGGGVISPAGFKQFVEFAGAHHIDLNTVPDLRRDVYLGLAQGGLFLETETTLFLKADEVAVLDAPVTLLKEVAERQYKGSSQGISVPLGHGVRYRVGAYRGQMVTVGHHWEPADQGPLTVTDTRVVFHGGRKTLEFPFSKLSALHTYSDAIALGVTSRQTVSTFRTGDPVLLAGAIQAAVAHQDDITIMKVGYQD
jgi:hypothetical protein